VPGIVSFAVMKNHFFWLSFVIGSVLYQIPQLARAQSSAGTGSEQWNGIQRLQVDLSSHETAPFLAWNAPALTGTRFDTSPASERKSLERRSPGQSTSERTQSRSAAPEAASTSSTSADIGFVDHKHQLRDALAHDGQSSLEDRDSLTHEAVSVIKWTVVTLVLGGVTVVGLKKFPIGKATNTASQRIRVLETLTLGRQQGLKLVEVGGERFLIASDQGGIKSVTLLPGWPELDHPEAEDQTLNFSSASKSVFEETLNKVAA